MGGQLLDTRCHLLVFCVFRGVLHPTAGFIQLGLLLERLEAEASTPLSQQTGWNEQRLGKATTCRPMNLSQRNGGAVGVVQSTKLDDVFGVGHVFAIFVGNFLE